MGERLPRSKTQGQGGRPSDAYRVYLKRCFENAHHVAESLAGPVGILELDPLSLAETRTDATPAVDYRALWLSGGFPMLQARPGAAVIFVAGGRPARARMSSVIRRRSASAPIPLAPGMTRRGFGQCWDWLP